MAGLDAATIARVTRAPGRYGFHGTLKAPFALRDGATTEGLAHAVDALAAAAPPVVLDSLMLTAIGRFLALVPGGSGDAIDALARLCVTGLDRFRAPLDDAERRRRDPERLSARQARLLEDWGYPYVLEEYRFHMTLTGPIESNEREVVGGALAAHGAGIFARPVTFADLCLFGDPGDGRPFRLIRRCGLGRRGAREGR